MKEKSIVSIGGVFLSIGVNVVLFWGLILIFITTVFINPFYYERLFLSPASLDVFYEVMDKESEFEDLDVDVEDILSRDFIKHYVHDLVAHFFMGEDVDYDYYEDYVRDELAPLVEDEADYSMSRDELNSITEDFLENIEDVFADDDGFEVFENLKDIIHSLYIACAVLAGLLVFFIGIMVFTYKIKARVLRNVSIATLVAAALNTAIWGVFKIAVGEVIIEGIKDADKELSKMVNTFTGRIYIEPLLISFILVIVSIVGIIVACKLIKEAVEASKEEEASTPAPAIATPAEEYMGPTVIYNSEDQTYMVDRPVTPAPATSEPEPVVASEVIDSAERNPNWFCPNCNTLNTNKFCSNCGSPRPDYIN